MGFTELWESAMGPYGWAVLWGGTTRSDLVQIRGAEEKSSWFRKRQFVILLKSELGTLAEILEIENVNRMVSTGLLKTDIAEVDELGHGAFVTVLLGTDALGLYRVNMSHAEVIMDRIAAGELDPSPDLVRCLRGTPAFADRMAAIALGQVLATAGPGRIPSEDERLARITPVLQREEIRLTVVRLFEEGRKEEGHAAIAQFTQATEQAVERHKQEFGVGD